MTTRVFQFNPMLYRIANYATWERLGEMDGSEVTVLSVADVRTVRQTMGLTADEDPVAHETYEVCNLVQWTGADGHAVRLLVFNSELAPLPEPADPGQTA